jgi:hypothetical protein
MTARFGFPEIVAADRRAPQTWWVWPWGSGRPSVVQVPGFLAGRDVLHIDLDPRRFRGPILLRTRPSDNRRDGLVTVNGATLVVVPGVPNLSDRDLRVNVRGIPATAVWSAMVVDRAGGGWGQDRPVSVPQGRGWAA